LAPETSGSSWPVPGSGSPAASGASLGWLARLAGLARDTGILS
jgi:hypothetical protein